MKLVRKLNQKLEQGLSLVETSMVLVVLAVMIGGSMVYYGQASEASKLRSAQELVFHLQSAVQSMTATEANYSNVDIAQISSTGVVPDTYMSPDRATITHPWAQNNNGFQVLVEQANSESQYFIIYTTLPKTACAGLATFNPGKSLVALNINNKPLALNEQSSVKASKCDKDSSNNTIEWTFK